MDNTTNEMYELDNRIAELLKNKNADQVSEIYYKLLKGKMNIIKEKFPLMYLKTTHKLYNRHYIARMIYFKACRVWFKFPSPIMTATKFIVNWLYRKTVVATYKFYNHIKTALDCENFISIIYTVESLKWKKTISEFIRDNGHQTEDLVLQN